MPPLALARAHDVALTHPAPPARLVPAQRTRRVTIPADLAHRARELDPASRPPSPSSTPSTPTVPTLPSQHTRPVEPAPTDPPTPRSATGIRHPTKARSETEAKITNACSGSEFVPPVNDQGQRAGLAAAPPLEFGGTAFSCSARAPSGCPLPITCACRQRLYWSHLSADAGSTY